MRMYRISEHMAFRDEHAQWKIQTSRKNKRAVDEKQLINVGLAKMPNPHGLAS